MSRVAAGPRVPGRFWYVVAIAIFIAGMALMGVFLITRLSAFDAALVRLVVPGEQTIPLEKGRHTIFHESHSVIDGKVYSSESLGGLKVTVTAPGGSAVELTPSGSGHYNMGSHSGNAIFDFTAEAAGDYAIAGNYEDGATSPQTVLAVGPTFSSTIVLTVLGSLGIAFGGAVSAAGLAVLVLVKRRRAGLRF